MLYPIKLQLGSNATRAIFHIMQIVEKALEVTSLEDIRLKTDLVDETTDQSTVLHQKFYDIFKNFEQERNFLNQYYIVIAHLKQHFLYKMYWQSRPTFRIHLPENKAVGSFHKDSDFGHSPHEINVFMPLTNAYDTNTFWLDDGSGTFRPVEASVGSVVLFDGANTPHGNYINNTEDTRVSFDFRLIPAHLYEKGGLTVTTGKKFELGDYWHE